MIQNQYFILAREIQKTVNGLFSFIDVSQHLAVERLPAEGKFDIGIICGPGWEAGQHRIHIGVQIPGKEPVKIGYADVFIADETHIYTAIINKLTLAINDDKGFSFLIYKESGELKDVEDTKQELLGALIIERPFKVRIVNQPKPNNPSNSEKKEEQASPKKKPEATSEQETEVTPVKVSSSSDTPETDET